MLKGGVRGKDSFKLNYLFAFCIFFFLLTNVSYAQIIPTTPFFNRSDNPEDVANTLSIILLLTILTVAPAILLTMTAFLRIVIVLSFLRRALGTPELPPNQVIVSLGLILTFLVMMPTLRKFKDSALLPYLDKKISQKEFLSNSVEPFKQFMLKNLRDKDLATILKMAGVTNIKQIRKEDIEIEFVVSAFIISELRRAFIMGFLVYLPFLIVDLIISSILVSLGMLVLPPILISLPLKILIFVLADGWNIVIQSLFLSFKV
ncbi:MAG: flagellar type III secretion system pore protein FliP [Planctomycetota bacterium]